MTKTATTDTETGRLPHSPPSVMTSVPRKLLKGRPGMLNPRDVAAEKPVERNGNVISGVADRGAPFPASAGSGHQP